MSTSFRSEVFKLCKKLQKDELSQKIGKTICDLSVVVESKENDKQIKYPHGDFAYLARQSSNEFLGYLYLDDNIGKLEFPHFFNPEHLSKEERNCIEQGHRTLALFIELCLADIASKSEKVAASLSPYYFYKDAFIHEKTNPLLSTDELMPAVLAFKNGITYKELMATNIANAFTRIDSNSFRNLVGTFEKEINRSLGEDVAKDIKDFSMKLHSKLSNASDVMFAYLVLMQSLKTSLKLACRLLYRAICGIDFFVLNNDNIINIEKRISTVLSDFYKVFSQDMHFDFTGSEMGSVLLIDCDLPHDTHIHEFGMLISQTDNFGGEFGASAKYSFVTLNEELIHIHRLVGEVLRIGLPVINSF